MNRTLALLTLLLPGVTFAQFPRIQRWYPPNMQYQYSPGLSAAQQARLKQEMDALLKPPVLIGTRLSDAVNTILNEDKHISALLGPTPGEIAGALDRAAVRVPVQAVVSQSAAAVAGQLGRVKRLMVRSAAVNSTIATSQEVIFIRDGRVSVYRSPLLAMQVRRNVQELLNTAASRQ